MHAEREQLARISAGDAAAFGRWASSVESSLRWSLRLFAERCDTEAVVQEALLRVWQVAPRFVHDGKPNALLRFAVTTARNVALSEARKTVATPTEFETLQRAAEGLHDAQPRLPDPHLREAIVKCREKLPAKPSAALTERLTQIEDDSVLATRINMSLNTFLQNVTRARKFLVDCLKKAGIDLELELSP